MFSNNGQLESVVRQLIRVGIVTSVDFENLTARVEFKDRSGMVSHDLKVIVKNSINNKDYWLPDLDEQVLCLCLPTGTVEGFILGSFYSKVTKSTEANKDKRSVTFQDGTNVEYDREKHKLTIDVTDSSGEVVVNAGAKVVVNAPQIELGENLALEPSVLGDKLANWVDNELKPWLDDHTHISAAPGSPSGKAKEAPSGSFETGSAGAGGAVYSTKNKNQ